MGRKGDIFYVDLSIEDAAREVTLGILDEGETNKVVSEYGDLKAENGFYILVFEKKFFKSSNKASLTVCLHKADEKTRVYSISSGGAKWVLFNSTGQEVEKFEMVPRSVLKEYIYK